MTFHVIRLALCLAMGLLLAGGSLAQAQDSIESVTKSMQARYRDLYKAKLQGKIGETHDGFVAAVKGGGDASQLINAENADRRKLYALLAEKEGTTAAKVAEVAATRNFKNASPQEWLRGPDGQWYQKKSR